jgi:hypothetical protein
MSGNGRRVETEDGTPLYVNPEFVMLLSPAFDKTGVPVVGQCVLHIAGGKIVVKGSLESVADLLWDHVIQRVELA